MTATQLESTGYRQPIIGLSSSAKPQTMSGDIFLTQPHVQQQQQSTCAGCQRAITDRYLLKIVRRRTPNHSVAGETSTPGADDTTSNMIWHEGCLKCSCCSCILIRVSATLYVRGDLLLCRQDYLRLYGKTSECLACSNVITPFEMVMKVRGGFYHNDCFACHHCKKRLQTGSHCYVNNDQIWCENDWNTFKHNCLSGASTVGLAGSETDPGPSMRESQLNFCETGIGEYLTMPPLVGMPVAGGGGVPDGAESLGDDASSGYGSPSPDTSTERRAF